MTTDRHTPALERVIHDALRKASLGAPARVEPLSAQLGTRRFARVWLEGGKPETLIARIEAPEDPGGRPAGSAPEPPLEPIRALLEVDGLPVPRRYGGDPSLGVELLEDLGARSLAQLASEVTDAERRTLYTEACDLVPRLQHVANPGGVAAFERHLDRALFAYKADLFAGESLRRKGRAASAAETRCVREAFDLIAAEALRAPQRLAHRDFQSENLMWAARPQPQLVMIDLQGAFLAPPEYDLVCLLRDSYVELPEDEIHAQLERIRPLLPDAPEPDVFAARFDLLTLTRKGKDHARFLYAARSRGDERFLRFAPRTLSMLRAAAARSAERDPRFAAFSALLAELPEVPCAR